MTVAVDNALRANENVFARDFDGEIVLLDLTGGVYYGLDGLASRIWTLATNGQTLRQVAHDVIADYDIDEPTLLNDVVSLAREWIDKGLAKVRE